MKRVSQHDEAAYKTNLKILYMTHKAIVSSITIASDQLTFKVNYYEMSNGPYEVDVTTLYAYYSDYPTLDLNNSKDIIKASVAADASGKSYSLALSDILILTGNLLTDTQLTALINGTQAKSVTDGVSHSFVTTAAAANGFQVSSTRDSLVSYSVSVSSVVQIGVATNVAGYCVLEVAATNSTTAADWKEKGRVGTGQNIALALALSSTQVATAPLISMVPAGYYSRLRTVNSNGTPTYTYISGTEVLI